MKNTGFFHFSLADFGRARSRTGVFRTVFYSVFWRRASRPIKNRRFWPKNAPPPPPPGKPVTFYERHPEDHAPAPSVRADLQHITFTFAFTLYTLHYIALHCIALHCITLDISVSQLKTRRFLLLATLYWGLQAHQDKTVCMVSEFSMAMPGCLKCFSLWLLPRMIQKWKNDSRGQSANAAARLCHYGWTQQSTIPNGLPEMASYSPPRSTWGTYLWLFSRGFRHHGHDSGTDSLEVPIP